MLGGMWLCTQWESKIKRKWNKQTIPNRTSPSQSTRDLEGWFFSPLVFIWVFGPEFSRLYLSFPTLSRKKKKSLCLSLECNDEEQRDRHKTKERKASSLCSILVLALGSSTSYLKKKFKSVLNKSTKNNQSVFQNPPFMKNSLCFTREKTLFFFLNSSLWILSLSQRVVETGKMFCFTLSFPPALLYIVLWKTGS